MSRWFLNAGSGLTARVRLFCFPHAGAGATSFARWQRLLPDSIAVTPCQLPGREWRRSEQPLENMDELLDALVPELLPLIDRDFAFFGHSMGAWIGYGVAHRLRAAGGPQPARLIVSSCRPPHLPPRLDLIGSLRDRALLEEVQRRYGLIPNVIMTDPVLLQMFLRILQSDIALFESTRFGSEPQLDCPISAYAGADDEAVPPEDVHAWSRHTASPDFDFRVFPGGHHYLRNSQGDMFQAVADSLTCVLTRA